VSTDHHQAPKTPAADDSAAAAALLGDLQAAGEQTSIAPRGGVPVGRAAQTQSAAVRRARAALDQWRPATS